MKGFLVGKGEFEFTDCLLDVKGVLVCHGREGAASGIGIFLKGFPEAAMAEEEDEGGVEEDEQVDWG